MNHKQHQTVPAKTILAAVPQKAKARPQGTGPGTAATPRIAPRGPVAPAPRAKKKSPASMSMISPKRARIILDVSPNKFREIVESGLLKRYSVDMLHGYRYAEEEVMALIKPRR